MTQIPPPPPPPTHTQSQKIQGETLSYLSEVSSLMQIHTLTWRQNEPPPASLLLSLPPATETLNQSFSANYEKHNLPDLIVFP